MAKLICQDLLNKIAPSQNSVDLGPKEAFLGSAMNFE
jgi:hypothetical protein